MRVNSLALAIVVALTSGFLLPKAVAETTPAVPVNDVVAQFHFIGTKQLAADPNATNLDKIGAMPETIALRDKFLDKMAGAPFRLLHYKFANQNTNDYTSLIRPLVSDLLEFECYAEMRGPTNKMPELMLAVHLDSQEAAIWHSNLSTVISQWTGIPTTEISGDGFKGWELKKHHDPNVIRCLRAGDWVLFGWGWEDLRLQPEFLQRIKKTKRPVELAKENFLDAWIDWPGITPYHPISLPLLSPYQLPKMYLTVQVQRKAGGQIVRPQLVMDFPEPLNVKLSPWRFPTNTIRNPVVSFTAVRGVAPWLKARDMMKQEPDNRLPNQFCVWAMAAVPFETYLAAPARDATNYLAELVPHILPFVNGFLTNRAMVTHAVWTNDRVAIPDLPFIMPALRAMHENAGDFLLGSMFALPPRKDAKPMPAELIKEINSKPNLVYYDWEMNRERISQWRQFTQAYMLTDAKELPSPALAGQKWLTAVSANLGNCGTEISLTAPNELTLIRNGPLGLTGIEMNLLVLSLDAPGFPLDMSYPHKRAMVPAPHH